MLREGVSQLLNCRILFTLDGFFSDLRLMTGVGIDEMLSATLIMAPEEGVDDDDDDDGEGVFLGSIGPPGMTTAPGTIGMEAKAINV